MLPYVFCSVKAWVLKEQPPSINQWYYEIFSILLMDELEAEHLY